MSDPLEIWRRRMALVRGAMKNSAPTGGGGAPAHTPAKPPDAPAAVPTFAADRGVVSRRPAPVELPSPRPSGLGKSSVTLSQKQLRSDAKRQVRLNGPQLPAEASPDRPKTRGDCYGGERPCPYVSCRYHTYLDVTPAGSLVINRPDIDVADLKASCSLDIADQGPITLEQVGAVMNVTRERVRQFEAASLQKLAVAVDPAAAAAAGVPNARFKGPCKARCALTGKVCALPSHGKERKHRCGPWEFHLVALEGQTYFPRANEIDGYAIRREGADVL